jgi:hypothetical protein
MKYRGSNFRAHRWLPKDLSEWAAWATIVGCILAVIPFLPELRGHKHQTPAKSLSVKMPPDAAASLQLTCPHDGEAVDIRAPVCGVTDLPPTLHFYVRVVSPDGTETIQDTPMAVSQNGKLSGYAAFGSKQVGSGKLYHVSIFATHTALSTRDRQIPDDAQFSNAVTVKRTEEVPHVEKSVFQE